MTMKRFETNMLGTLALFFLLWPIASENDGKIVFNLKLEGQLPNLCYARMGFRAVITNRRLW